MSSILCIDLDNTLIYSYKHPLSGRKRCVEIYHGREISFLTERTYQLLLKIEQLVRIIPVTTRTVEQYERIALGIGPLPYALVCNGGVLLVDGRQDAAWYERSLELVEDCRGELERAVRYLELEDNRIFEIRLINGLFVFTKCRFPQQTVQRMVKKLQLLHTDVFCNGEKVYVVPKVLNKGTAVQRFREYIKAEQVLAAGDSLFDIPMLEQADVAVAPYGCAWTENKLPGHIRVMPQEGVFSEFLLEFLLDYLLESLGADSK